MSGCERSQVNYEKLSPVDRWVFDYTGNEMAWWTLEAVLIILGGKDQSSPFGSQVFGKPPSFQGETFFRCFDLHHLNFERNLVGITDLINQVTAHTQNS